MAAQDENLQLLKDWHNIKAEAEKARVILAQEAELRKQVFAAFFDTPSEGTNTVDLPNGWKLKGVYKLDRKVDESSLDAVKEGMRVEMGVNPDPLVKYTPSLVKSKYNGLTQEQKNFFDAALTIKPQSPTLELVQPEE